MSLNSFLGASKWLKFDTFCGENLDAFNIDYLSSCLTILILGISSLLDYPFFYEYTLLAYIFFFSRRLFLFCIWIFSDMVSSPWHYAIASPKFKLPLLGYIPPSNLWLMVTFPLLLCWLLIPRSPIFWPSHNLISIILSSSYDFPHFIWLEFSYFSPFPIWKMLCGKFPYVGV